MEVSPVLADQLEMTDGTWAALREHGVSEGEWRSVDYSFDTSEEQRALSLRAALLESGASADVTSGRAGLLRRKVVWAVSGQTAPILMSAASLRNWVTEMVELGGDHESIFDGWGAEV